MKNKILITACTVMTFVFSSSLMAQTRVDQVNEDTLRVVKLQGKPPFKRLTLTRSNNPEMYAYYENMLGKDAQPVFSVVARTAPGKSLPGSRQRISSEPLEIAEFARFEESDEAPANNSRRWRGAPGKSLPRLQP